MPLILTDRTCTSCGSRLWAAPAGDLELVGCPSCDRPRCSSCREPFGFLFAPYVRRYCLVEEGGRCEHCLTSPATEHERREAA